MAMVSGKKPPASTPYLAQRRDGALSLTIGCSTRHWLDHRMMDGNGDRNGDGNGDGSEDSSGDENGDEDNRNGNEDGIGEGGR